MLQYYSSLLAIRERFNSIISSGKLFQQFLIDSFMKVEKSSLNFVRYNQDKLKGLTDCNDNSPNNFLSRQLILPSSIEGSPRNIRERCNDAMAIFKRFGSPDLFITFTANITWPEVISNLKFDQQYYDRPDLIVRVFHIKLRALINDLVHNKVFGNIAAYAYSVEFTKKGIPHAHIVLTLDEESKLKSPEDIDGIICAEIPDKEKSPKLFKLVTHHMLHQHCCQENTNAPCMKDGVCSKSFYTFYANYK